MDCKHYVGNDNCALTGRSCEVVLNKRPCAISEESPAFYRENRALEFRKLKIENEAVFINGTRL